MAITETIRSRRKTAAGGRREEPEGEIARRAEDNEPADHRVSTLIKFVVPGTPRGRRP